MWLGVWRRFLTQATGERQAFRDGSSARLFDASAGWHTILARAPRRGAPTTLGRAAARWDIVPAIDNLALLPGCFAVSSAVIPMASITLLLNEREGSHASEELLPLVYDELRRLAAARMAGEAPGQTLQPTALVHEAWLRVFSDGHRRWQSRGHFFGEAAEAMRRILIERARRRSRLKHGGGWVRIDLDGLELAAAEPDEAILAINDALERLEAEDAERARIVVMKFFGGLTNLEVAESLGVAERTVERQWAYAKAWLLQNIREHE